MDQELRAYLDERFGSMEQHLGGMRQRLEAIEQWLVVVEDKRDTLLSDVNDLKAAAWHSAEVSLSSPQSASASDHKQQMESLRSSITLWRHFLGMRLDSVERDIKDLRQRLGVS